MTSVATTINIMLGVFNAVVLIRSRRVSLLVVPTIPLQGPARAEDRDTYEMRIQVVNLSVFPVYITEVGLKPRDGNDPPIKYVSPQGLSFPFELKPRESVRLLPAERDFMRVSAGRFRCAYARTACGRTRTGTSPSLQEQERNVFHYTGGTTEEREKLRIRQIWERVACHIRSAL
ncbi:MULTISPECIES: hypothetical protein [Paraburkholderia]|uniref:hypothetical protein n=1 Tax=Paraburkholderia TaxID=1822464 RepID=UPI002AB6B7BB|nr:MULTISPECIES: hypothetical protein [Paraburkholderia]